MVPGIVCVCALHRKGVYVATIAINGGNHRAPAKPFIYGHRDEQKAKDGVLRLAIMGAADSYLSKTYQDGKVVFNLGKV